MSSALSIRDLNKKFEGAKDFVLKGISLEVNSGEILALTGESGCGKTTLLRTIAGFENIQGGSISILNETMSNSTKTVKPEARNVGLVFQDLALFPHMTVSKNIAYGISKLSNTERKVRTDEVMELTNLTGLEKRYPHELSGGQKQRVALARALVAKPKILLMDEPFSNLDEILRVKVRHEIKGILSKSGITTIMVTHDSQDAFSMADKIAILKNGKMIQIGNPIELYNQPQNPYVARFFGEISIISGVKKEGGIQTKFGLIQLKAAKNTIKIGIRPEAVSITTDEEKLKGKVNSIQYLGAHFEYQVAAEDGGEHIHLRSQHKLYEISDVIHFDLGIDRLIVFDDPSEKKI